MNIHTTHCAHGICVLYISFLSLLKQVEWKCHQHTKIQRYLLFFRRVEFGTENVVFFKRCRRISGANQRANSTTHTTTTGYQSFKKVYSITHDTVYRFNRMWRSGHADVTCPGTISTHRVTRIQTAEWDGYQNANEDGETPTVMEYILDATDDVFRFFSRRSRKDGDCKTVVVEKKKVVHLCITRTRSECKHKWLDR